MLPSTATASFISNDTVIYAPISCEFDVVQSVKASIKDTTVNGVEGFNIQWEVPFKVQDYVVGFKYNVGDMKKTPDSLFAKKSFSTSGQDS